MVQAKSAFMERRKYVRLLSPINVSYVTQAGRAHTALTKNISADGLRFQAQDKALNISDVIELKLDIPGAVNPVHSKASVIWKKKLSLEDRAPFDVGLAFAEIEEDNKNTFLKFLCDIIYDIKKEPRHEHNKG